jgi:hypothetical protein
VKVPDPFSDSLSATARGTNFDVCQLHSRIKDVSVNKAGQFEKRQDDDVLKTKSARLQCEAGLMD